MKSLILVVCAFALVSLSQAGFMDGWLGTAAEVVKETRVRRSSDGGAPVDVVLTPEEEQCVVCNITSFMLSDCANLTQADCAPIIDARKLNLL